MDHGYIQIYTGSGKGKTTAALGLAIRAAGAGLKVALVYFDKGGDFYHERVILDRITEIEYHVSGLVRFDPDTQQFRFGVTSEDRAEARRGQALTIELLQSGRYDLVICDEINSTCALGMLTVAEVLTVVAAKPQTTELVLTGRNCPPEILAVGDLITEMRPQKHYFDQDVPARSGIEF